MLIVYILAFITIGSLLRMLTEDKKLALLAIVLISAFMITLQGMLALAFFIELLFGYFITNFLIPVLKRH